MIIQPEVRLEWITPNSASVIEMAARTCYKSESLAKPEHTDDFVDRVVNQRHHESVVEHATASFRVITDIGIGREVTRHRIASFSQESTRYVNYCKERHGAGDIQFIHPLDLTPEQLEFSEWAYNTIAQIYIKAIELGMKPEQARDYLPLGAKTELVMTANFREWLHFLKLRTDKAAHAKMQVVANMIGAILAKECPVLFKKYGEPDVSSVLHV